MTHFPPCDLFPWAEAPGAWPLCPTASSQLACSGFLLRQWMWWAALSHWQGWDQSLNMGICESLWIHSWILTSSVPFSCYSSELVVLWKIPLFLCCLGSEKSILSARDHHRWLPMPSLCKSMKSWDAVVTQFRIKLRWTIASLSTVSTLSCNSVYFEGYAFGIYLK